MSGSIYTPAAIREVWQEEGKQRWDGQTHGRGLCLLIVEILQGALIPGRPSSSNRSFEFWRDQKKIRGRFIGDIVGGGVVVIGTIAMIFGIQKFRSVQTLSDETAEIIKDDARWLNQPK